MDYHTAFEDDETQRRYNEAELCSVCFNRHTEVAACSDYPMFNYNQTHTLTAIDELLFLLDCVSCSPETFYHEFAKRAAILRGADYS